MHLCPPKWQNSAMLAMLAILAADGIIRVIDRIRKSFLLAVAKPGKATVHSAILQSP
jgi:hypothetical protein